LYKVSIQANDAGIDFSDLAEAHLTLPPGFAMDVGALTQRKFYPDSIQANDAGIDFSDLTEAHKKLPPGFVIVPL
jgi:hypothetical protein